MNIEKLLERKAKLENALKEQERKVKAAAKKARTERGENVLKLMESAGVLDATDAELASAFAGISAKRLASTEATKAASPEPEVAA